MNATFLILSPSVADLAIKAIRALKYEEPHEVVIRPKKRDRSMAQHRLYWGPWLTFLAGHTGENKEALHEDMKRRHLIPIFRRDDPDYNAMIMAVQRVPKGPDLDAIKKQVVRLTSTTKCSVEQFTEYLNAVEATALDLGCVLPHPSDLYLEAMGIK